MKAKVGFGIAALLCCIAAVIWTVNAALRFTYEPLLAAGQLVCAVIWWAAAAVNFYRYRTRTTNSEKNKVNEDERL